MDKEILIFAIGVSLLGTATGALIGWGMSVTAFSPLAVGGIIGSVVPVFLAIVFASGAMSGFGEKDFKKFSGILLSLMAPISAAIGVGLAAAATAISPGIMLGAGSAALTGATIGAIAIIAPMAGFFVAEGVSEYVISPIAESFSSQKQEVIS